MMARDCLVQVYRRFEWMERREQIISIRAQISAYYVSTKALAIAMAGQVLGLMALTLTRNHETDPTLSALSTISFLGLTFLMGVSSFHLSKQMTDSMRLVTQVRLLEEKNEEERKTWTVPEPIVDVLLEEPGSGQGEA